ncbi:hypothetical protein BCR36DRAFT_364135 [Piromyces finnis]|uniref:Chitin-binding type-1 domain-containing protein n=1 Tax=Piromyces finnis TaxID=1754191 RepID=A0A1Y1UU16_9FUNG|nr:hypothetical protein BCR36DRAFT_364135 [Piromyces finnis]|eukprot:ORX41509.1 hypothetical protein BCR36DRAFT_364135 [Piromyces finnis]
MKLNKYITGLLLLICSTNSAPIIYIKDRCGAKYGNCEAGKCCSKYGWCGKASAYCSISRGCQSEFGICTSSTTTSTKYATTKYTTASASKIQSTPTIISKDFSIVKTNINYKAMNSLNTNPLSNIQWAGFRYSSYGIESSFKYIPNSNSLVNYISKIKNQFYDDTKGAVFLIVGVESNNKYCTFGFPKPKNVSSSLNVKFSDIDEYEDFLKNCDEKGYEVWLQVEPGDNDLVELANIVFDHYGHHPSVKGFGIDCEWWYRYYSSEHHGKPLSDEEAKRIVEAVRKRNSKYTVFAKHWETSYMPPTYRDGMVFVNDSQGFGGNLNRMTEEFQEWARTFPNNPVVFQIGYNADKVIWNKKPIEISKTIADNASKYNNNIGIIWVDFTMKDALENM